MIAGIAVDDWKLPTFRRILTEEGYYYKDGGALLNAVTLLQVEYTNLLDIKRVVERCQAECRKAN